MGCIIEGWLNARTGQQDIKLPLTIVHPDLMSTDFTDQLLNAAVAEGKKLPNFSAEPLEKQLKKSLIEDIKFWGSRTPMNSPKPFYQRNVSRPMSGILNVY